MEKARALLQILFFLSALSFSFQNCSDVEFSGPTAGLQGSSGVSGQNIDFTDEEDPLCQEQQQIVLGLWVDPSGDGVAIDDNYLGEIVAYQGAMTAGENYNYYSASAHPHIGPSPEGFASHVFFYEGSDGLSLNFYANVDNGGSQDNQFDVDVMTSGNQGRDTVLESDDGGELKDRGMHGEAKLYEGRFHYWNNTDGGVIGPFSGQDFSIRFGVLLSGDIASATFYSADGRQLSLGENQNIQSFIIGFRGYTLCP